MFLCLVCQTLYAVLPNSLHSQVRQGIATNTKGTAFVVYEDVMDAKQACDKLNGFNFQGRYLVGTSRAIAYNIRVAYHLT
jgi:hypothetical protein